MLKDLHFSIRTLLAQPAFAAVAILTLAIGIGANAAIFSILNAVLIEDLPYEAPDRLYMLKSRNSGAPTGMMAPRHVEPLEEGHPLVEAAALAWALSGSVQADDGTPYPILPYRVTPRFFDVFSGEIALGRGFERNEPPQSIVLSYDAWRDHFRSDPDIIGAPITIDDSQRLVVGVARESFEFPIGAEAWQPFDPGPQLGDRLNFEAYLRLKPNVSGEQLEGELARLSEELGPNSEIGERLIYSLVPLLDEIVGDLGTTIMILSGATAILLLIACLNVANLQFSRAIARSHEIGLREAIGAGRLRIVRQLLTESLVLSAIGGILGIALAFAGVRLLLGLGPADLPRLNTVSVDGRVLLFSVGSVLLTSLLIGLAPAARLRRTQLRALLASGGRGGSAGRGEMRVLGGLVVAEVALAVVLVTGAGLLARSYVNLTAVDAGFDPDRILTIRMNATHIPFDVQVVQRPDGTVEYTGSGHQPVIDFYDELKRRIRGLPGVVDVAGGQELPLHPNQTQASPEPFSIMGRGSQERMVRIRTVSDSFFSLLGASILSGRDFEPTDRRGSPGVAVINEAFARQYFPDVNPVGQNIRLPSTDYRLPTPEYPNAGRGYGFAERIYDSVEVVGVVEDVRFVDLGEPPPPYLFMSTAQFTTFMRNFAVKTDFDEPESLVSAIRREIAEMAPTVPVEFTVYSETVDASIARQRLGMALLMVFGAIALILAAVGIYGVMAYSVTQRTGEIAVRAAMGATQRAVLGLVLRRGVTLGLIGVLLGLIGAVGLRRVISSELYGISVIDSTVLTLVGAVLLGVSIFACLVPARRASKIDPMVALRHE